MSKLSAWRRSASLISLSLVFIAGHLLPHPLQASRYGGLHRSDPPAQDAGGLFLREVLVESQHDRGALSVREAFQCSPNGVARFDVGKRGRTTTETCSAFRWRRSLPTFLQCLWARLTMERRRYDAIAPSSRIELRRPMRRTNASCARSSARCGSPVSR